LIWIPPSKGMQIKLAAVLLLAACLASEGWAEVKPLPVIGIGVFSDMKATEEHQYGTEVRLWRQGRAVFGLFSYAEGLIGDTPTGLLEDIHFDTKSGQISFRAKLTMGQHFCKLHQGIPSRDLFRFRGVLTKDSLSGRLDRFDGLHPEKQAMEEQVVLKRRNTGTADLSTFQSRSQWDKEAKEILRFRGPKW
jgi:hypothetical protein